MMKRKQDSNMYGLSIISCLLLLLLSSFAFQATAKPLIGDMSEYHVDIDSSFTGKNLLLFGARNEPGDLLIVVRGPKKNVTIRKKENVAGIWMNTEQVTFLDIPFYYAISGTQTIDALEQSHYYKLLGIGLDRLDFTTPKPLTPGMKEEFSEAFIQTQKEANLYQEFSRTPTFMDATLFKTKIIFPDTLPRGNYAVDLYLFEDGVLKSMQSLPIEVTKVGFDAFIYDLAHNHSLIYGLSAILIAVMVGWAISLLFNRIW